MKHALVAAALVATALFAGCTTPTAQGCTNGTAPDNGGTLRILDHGAFDYMIEAIRPAFENQTGSKLVQVKGEDAGEALHRAVEAKGNPIADVIYGIDNALFPEASRAGILLPYESPAVSKVAIGRDLFRHEGLLLATPADFGFVSVNYDARLTNATPAETLPTTLKDLAAKRWASDFVVQDPRLASPGLGFLVATVGTFGETSSSTYDYLDYWGELLDNGVLVTNDWTESYEVHFTAGYGQYGEGFVGDRHVVVSYSTSPAYEAYFSGADPPSVSLEPAKGVYRQVESVAILQCTPQPTLAKKFVDFVLTNDFQDQTGANMAMYPVVADADVLDSFDTYATPPQDLVSAPASPAVLERNVARWLNEWTELYETKRA